MFAYPFLMLSVFRVGNFKGKELVRAFVLQVEYGTHIQPPVERENFRLAGIGKQNNVLSEEAQRMRDIHLLFFLPNSRYTDLYV